MWFDFFHANSVPRGITTESPALNVVSLPALSSNTAEPSRMWMNSVKVAVRSFPPGSFDAQTPVAKRGSDVDL